MYDLDLAIHYCRICLELTAGEGNVGATCNMCKHYVNMILGCIGMLMVVVVVVWWGWQRGGQWSMGERDGCVRRMCCPHLCEAWKLKNMLNKI